jgi:arylsulfatase A-like enzyme
MIVADDLNSWASFLGDYAVPALMPNLDRLAASGVSFATAYAPTTLCNPSRTSFLTND